MMVEKFEVKLSTELITIQSKITTFQIPIN